MVRGFFLFCLFVSSAWAIPEGCGSWFERLRALLKAGGPSELSLPGAPNAKALKASYASAIENANLFQILKNHYDKASKVDATRRQGPLEDYERKVSLLKAMLDSLENGEMDTRLIDAFIADLKKETAHLNKMQRRFARRAIRKTERALHLSEPDRARKIVRDIIRTLEGKREDIAAGIELQQDMARAQPLIEARQRAEDSREAQKLDKAIANLRQMATLRFQGRFQTALTNSQLDRFFAEQFGQIPVTPFTLDTCERLLELERMISQKSLKFMKELRDTVPPQFSIERASFAHVQTAMELTWPGSEDVSANPKKGSFTERVERLVAKKDIPEVRKKFLVEQLALLDKWSVPLSHADPRLRILVATLEELYP